MDDQAIRLDYEDKGRFWFRSALSVETLSAFDHAADITRKPGERLSLTGQLASALSGEFGLGKVMKAFGKDLVPARIVAFNKTSDNNWAVPWHQDRVIAVAAQHDISGYGNWSCKNGAWHCEPPAAVLDQMFFVRVHLDDNTLEDGPMRIALESHKLGAVPAAEAKSIAERFPVEDCVARRGDVLVLKMLTLHSSSPSLTTNSRRVFRVDYAPKDLLPAPLEWS